ncbi:hypothetical protein FD755_012455, partial [Muntiacus reevesi]
EWETFYKELDILKEVLTYTGFLLLCLSQTEQLITLWVLFVFTIVGNAIVLFSTWRRKRKSRMTFFVTQLAITV